MADGGFGVGAEEGAALVVRFAGVLSPLHADGGQGGVLPEGVAAAVDHVLHDQHAQPVAGVIEPFRLHLNVLAQQIEAQLLHAQDIPLIFLRTGG